MTYLTQSLLFFSSLSLLLCFTIAGTRPVHGPAYLNPIAFSPAAYDFFHPKTVSPSPSSSSPSPSPSSSSPSSSSSLSSSRHNVETDTERSKDLSSSEEMKQEKKGATAGIVLGVAFTAFFSMGIYFVIAKRRRANVIRTIVVHSDA